MNPMPCAACGQIIRGRQIKFDFYIENAELNVRKRVSGLQCQHCGSLYCAAGKKKDHPKMSWWSGWESVRCPGCGELIGPGAMFVSLDAPEIIDPSVEPLLVMLEDNSETVLARAESAVALGQTGDARAVPPLVTTLGDDNQRLRQAAAYALFDIGAPAVDPLVAALSDKNMEKRTAAADVLGQIGEPALQPLVVALTGKWPFMRELAPRALGQIGDARAVGPLLAKLEDQFEGAAVRCEAAAALGQIGDRRAVEP